MAIAVTAAWHGTNTWYRSVRLEDLRRLYVVRALPLKEAFQSAIERRFALVEGLNALASTSTDLERTFSEFARNLIPDDLGIRNVSIAPGGVQRYVYPTVGNRPVVGHDLLSDPREEVRADVARAIATRDLVVSGPYELRQGGQGLVVRKAYFHDEEFAGLVAMVLDLPPVYRRSGVTDVDDITVSMVADDGRVFFRSHDTAPHRPVHVPFLVASERWELRVSPTAGWNSVVRDASRLFSYGTMAFAFFIWLVAVGVTNRLFSLSRKAQHEQERYLHLFNSIRDPIVVSDRAGIVTDANQPAPEFVMGYRRDELVGMNREDLFHDETEYRRYREDITNGWHDRSIVEARLRTKDGRGFDAEIISYPLALSSVPDGEQLSIIKDITREKQVRRALDAELEQKKTLVREIHHRVKNNLAQLYSLVELEKESIVEEQHHTSLINLQNRIEAMAIVHRHLYAASRLSTISIGSYLEELVATLAQSLESTRRHIRVTHDIHDAQLPVEPAQTVGLLVTELVTNAFKHAFTSDGGTVDVRFRRVEGEATLKLTVADDGRGYRPADPASPDGGVGQVLVALMVEQLSGSIQWSDDSGTTVSITFSP